MPCSAPGRALTISAPGSATNFECSAAPSTRLTRPAWRSPPASPIRKWPAPRQCLKRLICSQYPPSPAVDREDAYCETVPLPRALAEHSPRDYLGEEADQTRARDFPSASVDETIPGEATAQTTRRTVLAGDDDHPVDREGESAEPPRTVRPETLAASPRLSTARRKAASPRAPCQLRVFGPLTVPAMLAQCLRSAAVPSREAAGARHPVCRAQGRHETPPHHYYHPLRHRRPGYDLAYLPRGWNHLRGPVRPLVNSDRPTRLRRGPRPPSTAAGRFRSGARGATSVHHRGPARAL